MVDIEEEEEEEEESMPNGMAGGKARSVAEYAADSPDTGAGETRGSDGNAAGGGWRSLSEDDPPSAVCGGTGDSIGGDIDGKDTRDCTAVEFSRTVRVETEADVEASDPNEGDNEEGVHDFAAIATPSRV